MPLLCGVVGQPESAFSTRGPSGQESCSQGLGQVCFPLGVWMNVSRAFQARSGDPECLWHPFSRSSEEACLWTVVKDGWWPTAVSQQVMPLPSSFHISDNYIKYCCYLESSASVVKKYCKLQNFLYQNILQEYKSFSKPSWKFSMHTETSGRPSEMKNYRTGHIFCKCL